MIKMREAIFAENFSSYSDLKLKALKPLKTRIYKSTILPIFCVTDMGSLFLCGKNSGRKCQIKML
jgi:hypothetical protein